MDETKINFWFGVAFAIFWLCLGVQDMGGEAIAWGMGCIFIGWRLRDVLGDYE